MSIIPPSTRELDCRSRDGVEVRLLWRPEDDQLFVVVHDRRADEAFCLTVPEGERPLDVFWHPYAYAARRPHATHVRAASAPSAS